MATSPPVAVPPVLAGQLVAHALQVAAPTGGPVSCQQEALPWPGAAPKQIPAKPRWNPTPSLRELQSHLQTPRKGSGAVLYTHPRGVPLRHPRSLDSGPFLPPSWSKGASGYAGQHPSRDWTARAESRDCFSGQYPLPPLRRARQIGQAQVLAGEGGAGV